MRAAKWCHRSSGGLADSLVRANLGQCATVIHASTKSATYVFFGMGGRSRDERCGGDHSLGAEHCTVAPQAMERSRQQAEEGAPGTGVSTGCSENLGTEPAPGRRIASSLGEKAPIANCLRRAGCATGRPGSLRSRQQGRAQNPSGRTVGVRPRA